VQGNVDLDPELVERLNLVEQPGFEPEPLQRRDYQVLAVTGLLLPVALLAITWLAF
jgi:hypothetical protein